MNYKESKEYLKDLSSKGMILGLDNIKKLMESFGRPDKRLKFIHVAGTNGKGSVCTYLSNILSESGYKTGVYTSPEVYKFNERFVINGEMASDEEIAEIISDIRLISENENIQLTAFEVETALAVLYFAKNNCEFAILEVGLGGTLDATNFIDKPELGVLVEIGLDHTGILGDTLAEIASAKAGIIKENSVNISYRQRPEAKEVLDNKCLEENASISYIDLDDVELLEKSLQGQKFNYKEYSNIEISMLGSYQPYNASLAIEACDKLNELGHSISQDALRRGLKKAKIRGRFELINTNPVVIIDGAHNPDGAEVLAESLREFFPGKKHLFVFGSMRDKDYETVIDISLPFAKKYYTVMPNNDRALSSFELKRIIKEKGGEAVACGAVTIALITALKEAEEDDTIICFGSLYQVGQIISYFESGE